MKKKQNVSDMTELPCVIIVKRNIKKHKFAVVVFSNDEMSQFVHFRLDRKELKEKIEWVI